MLIIKKLLIGVGIISNPTSMTKIAQIKERDDVRHTCLLWCPIQSNIDHIHRIYLPFDQEFIFKHVY